MQKLDKLDKIKWQRKMPYKDKTGLKISPHGKNVYPVPQLNTGPALNTSQALRNGSINPPNSPPHSAHII